MTLARKVKQVKMKGQKKSGKKTEKKSAAEAAYAYLANRMRAVEEVRKHLESKEYTEAEITDAVNELIGMRYLDDYLFALRYYEYNREKRRGVLRGERELLEKGVDKETARNAKEDFLYENKVDEFEDALAIAEKMMNTTPDLIGEPVQTEDAGRDTERKPFDDKLAAKVARKLEGKGFAKGDIFRVLDTLRRESDRTEN